MANKPTQKPMMSMPGKKSGGKPPMMPFGKGKPPMMPKPTKRGK